MKNHPLGLAARYNDADAEEKGFVAFVESLGLDMDSLMYAVDQRATRCVLATTRPLILKELPTNGFAAIRLTERERTLHGHMQLALIDGIAIGWRAHQIKERDNG